MSERNRYNMLPRRERAPIATVDIGSGTVTLAGRTTVLPARSIAIEVSAWAWGRWRSQPAVTLREVPHV